MLSVGLSALIREQLARRLPTAKAFVTPRLDAFAKVLRKDCMAAGISTIDGAGREVDFHALRVTSASLMISGGFDVKLVQQRLGHHDPALTLKVYAMTYREVEADAVRRMPDLTAQPGDGAVQATGTDDVEPDGDDAEDHAQRAHNISVRGGSSSFVKGTSEEQSDGDHKPPKSKDKCAQLRGDSSPFVNAPGRTRTCDLRFRKPPLYPAELRAPVVRSQYTTTRICTGRTDGCAGCVVLRNASMLNSLTFDMESFQRAKPLLPLSATRSCRPSAQS